MLRFRVRIEVLWSESQKHKRLDSLVHFTYEKPAYRVLYLIAFRFDGVLPHLFLLKLSLASTESKKSPFV